METKGEVMGKTVLLLTGGDESFKRFGLYMAQNFGVNPEFQVDAEEVPYLCTMADLIVLRFASPKWTDGVKYAQQIVGDSKIVVLDVPPGVESPNMRIELLVKGKYTAEDQFDMFKRLLNG